MSYNEDERGIVVRKTVDEIFNIKLKLIGYFKELKSINDNIEKEFKEINGFSFHSLDLFRNAPRGCLGENSIEKFIDQKCWYYVVGLYHLEKFMLCTDFNKMMNQIERCDLPEFNVKNAESWMLSLKSVIHESVQKLIEDVFNRITYSTYKTGGWNAPKKKRNNNGIDSFFIISTGDISSINWYSSGPTITDDLEKACYIIDGKSVPDVTLKATLRKDKRLIGENDYFKITICNNGNTHYKWKNDDIRNKLNLYGSKRGIIGENVRIKILDKEKGSHF